MLKADRREETIQVIADEGKMERLSMNGTDKDNQLQMYILRVATVR